MDFLRKKAWTSLRERPWQINIENGVQFEFPDFSLHLGTFFPDFPWPHGTDLTIITWNSEWSEEYFVPAIISFLQKTSPDIRKKIGFT